MSFDIAFRDNDIVLDSGGNLEFVTATEKLIQDLTRAILTIKGENPFHPDYGTTLDKNIGLAVLSDSIAASEVQDVVYFLMREQLIQSRQQVVHPNELIVSLDSVTVQRDTTDPRQFNIIITITTQGYQTIAKTITIK